MELSMLKARILGLRTVFLMAIVALVAGCQPDSVNIQYKDPGGRVFEMIQTGYYSTFSNGEEQIGTVTQTYMEVRFSREGETDLFQKRFVADNSKGYHQHSMPPELMNRLHVNLAAKGAEVQAISGHETFIKNVVDGLQIPERFRSQLRQKQYPAQFDRILKKRWELRHLLQGEYPTEANVTSQVKESSPIIPAGVKLDSVFTRRVGEIDGRKCLDYDVYYRDQVYFPEYLREQWAYSTEEGKPYQAYQTLGGEARVQLTVSIDLADGTLCREMERRNETQTLKDPETGQSAEFDALVYIERLLTEKE